MSKALTKAQAALGARVRQLRERRDMKQSELGFDPTYISRLENGRVNPTLGVMLQLAKELECSLPTLLRGVGDK